MTRLTSPLAVWMLRLSLIAAGATVIPACGRTNPLVVIPYSISNATLASGTVGVGYTDTLVAASASGAVTWSVFTGTLPAGLALNAATGDITGIPTSPGGTAEVMIRAVDAAGQVTQRSFLISITGGVAGALTVTTSAVLPGGDVGTPYDYGFSALNGAPPFAWSVTAGALPPGIVVNPANGGLTGIPTTAGTFLFTIHAGDTGAGNSSVACSLTISSPLQITAATMPPGSVGGAYSRPSPVSGGSTPFLFSVASGTLPAGLALNTSTGVISGTPTTAATSGYVIRVTDAAGVSALASVSHVINPAPVVIPVALPASTQGLVYSQTLNATLGTGAYTWTLTGGALPAGLSLSAGGVISGTSTTPSGTSNFTVTVTDAANGTGSLALSIVINPPVTVSAATLVGWTVNQAGYSQTITAAGGTGARAFSVTGSLPIGLTINAATGVISGTPTATGTANFSIVATDSLGATGSNNFSITINLQPTITTATLPDWTQNFAYTPVGLGTTGGTLPFGWTVTAGTPWTGFNLGASTGIVSGTPTGTGSSTFTITLVDAAGASTFKQYTVVINPALSIPTTSPLAAWTQNFAGYSQTLSVNGGTGVARTWSAGAGLPTGLSLSAAGVVSGTPSAVPATYTFLATVTDTVGASVSKSFDIVINAPVTITSSSPLAPWTRTLAGYNQSVAATGGTGTKVWSNPGGGLPVGLLLNTATGAITGTPTTAGTSTFNIAVADAIGASTGNQSFSITINPVPSVTAAGLQPWTRTHAGYIQTIAATGGTGALTFSNPGGGMPGGLSLNSSTGSITGTPNTAGTFTFNIVATDTLLVASPAQSFTIIINPVPSVTPSALAAWTQNLGGYSQSVGATGGTGSLTFSNPGGGMPGGLSLIPSTGAITGTPNTAGTFTFNIVATDTLLVPSPAQSFSITINPPPSFTTTSPLPQWTQNLVGYSQTIVVGGGTGTLTVTNPGGGLPAGLSFSAGVISGKPTGTGTSTFNLQLTDGLGATTGPVSFSITINPPPSISTTSPLAPWTKDFAGYSQLLAATGGTGARTWSVSSGSLPSGLTLAPLTGVISGTPDTVAITTFDVSVKDSLNVSSTPVTLSITINPALAIQNGATLPAWTLGLAGYSQQLTANGGTGGQNWTKTFGSLPTGVTLSSGGLISGQPVTTSGTFNFTVQVQDAVGATATLPMSVVINPVPQISLPSTISPWTQFKSGYTYTIASTGGTGTRSLSIVSGGLPGSLVMDSTGAISGTPNDPANTYGFTVQVQDSLGVSSTLPMSIVINAPLNITSGPSLPAWTQNRAGYGQTLSATGGTGSQTWSIVPATGVLPTNMTLSVGGLVSGTPNVAGNFGFTAKVTDGVGASATLPMSININPPVSITTGSSLPDGALSVPYGQNFTVSGGTGPFNWTTSPTPNPVPGLTMSSGGNLSGVPSVPSSGSPFGFSVTVTDVAGSTSTVNPVNLFVVGPLSVGTSTLTGASAGNPYSASLSALGGKPPFTWSLLSGTPPSGITLDAAGNFSGTAPSVNGTSSFVVQVIDVGGRTASKAMSITVSGAAPTPLSIDTVSLNGATQGSPYNAGLAGSGGNPAGYQWTISAGALPSGLGLGLSTGVISGTPTATAPSFTVQLFDGASTVTKSLSITVNPPLIITTTSPLPDWTVNRSGYTGSLSRTGGTPPISWSVTSGATPAGLTLNSGGTFTGTPTVSGSSFFNVQVSDAAGATASTSMALNINPAPQVQNNFIPAGTQGVPFPVFSMAVQSFTGTGPFAWTSTPASLPFGLTLGGSGSITGTPSSSGSQSVDFTVTDAAGATALKTLSVIVNSPPSITTTTLPDGTINLSYASQQLNVNNGTPGFNWTITSGSLPTGMSMNTGGLISGTPTVGGPVTITVKATDANGAFDTKILSFTIFSGPTASCANITEGQTGVTRGSHVVLNFTAPMDQTTFTSGAGGTVTLSPDPSGGTVTTPILFYWTSPTSVTLVFDTQLPAGIHGDDLLDQGTLYTVTVGTGVKSTPGAGGLNLGTTFTLHFTTQTQTTSPTFTATPDLTVPVAPLTTTFVMTWSQPMTKTQGHVQIKSSYGFKADGQLNGSGVLDSGTAKNMSSMSWDGPGQVLTVVLSTGVPANSLFRFQVDNFRDATGSYYNQNGDAVFVTPGPTGTAPQVTGMLPTSGSTAPLDTSLIIGFTAPMKPAHLLDATKITVTVGGTPVSTPISRELVDFSGVFLNPVGAWPASSLITVTVKGDMENAAGVQIGSDTVLTFTTSAADTTAMAIDAPFSTLANGATDIDPFNFSAAFAFTRSAGARAFVNKATLAPRDVTIVEHASPNIPVKGYSVNSSNVGGLEIRSDFGWTGLKYTTQYDLTLNTTLQDTQGGIISTTAGANVLTFTTRPNSGLPTAARPTFFGGGGDSQYTTTPHSPPPGNDVKVDLRADVQSPTGASLTVTVSDNIDTAFTRNKVLSSFSSNFQYSSDSDNSGNPEPELGTAGDHIITFSADDGVHTASLSEKTFVFDTSQFPALTTPSNGATPTLNWGSVPGTLGAVGMAVAIFPASGGNGPIYIAILPIDATTFAVPADQALPAGTYKFGLHFFHPIDGSFQGASSEADTSPSGSFTSP